MIIRIDTRSQALDPTLEQPTDFGKFHAEWHGDDAAAFETAVQRIGRVAADDHIEVTRAALVSMAGDAADDPAWQESLEGMVAYAASKGWVTDDGAIRAHVVRVVGDAQA